MRKLKAGPGKDEAWALMVDGQVARLSLAQHTCQKHPLPEGIRPVDFAVAADGLTLWVLDANGLVHDSQDGGKTWKAQLLPGAAGTEEKVTLICAPGPQATDVMVITDQGKSYTCTRKDSAWKPHGTAPAEACRVCLSQDGQQGWLVTSTGAVHRTTNACEWWSPELHDGMAVKDGLYVSADGKEVWVAGPSFRLLRRTAEGKWQDVFPSGNIP